MKILTPRYTVTFNSDKTATVILNEEDSQMFDASAELLRCLENLLRDHYHVALYPTSIAITDAQNIIKRVRAMV